MVIPVSKFFSSRSVSQEVSSVPLLTSIPNDFSGAIPRSRFGVEDYREFWKKFENNSELIATLDIPITDILSERPEFTDLDGRKLNKRERARALKFWRDNRGKETLGAFLYDVFLTGDGYLWKGTPTKKELVRAMKEVMDAKGYSFQIKESDVDLLYKTLDEDVKKPKYIDYVASSTMEIIADEYDIKGYQQQSNGLISQFTPDQIIHFRYRTLNGRVNGFSPIKALTAEIILLTLIKGNMIAWLENGGTPDKVFVLPKEIANSKNHQYLIEVLKKYKKIQNRHGNLVFTGDIDIKDLQGNPKDMEYKDLALYVTSNIAFAFGIPVSRIPFLIGSSATGGDSGGLANQGYWSKISGFQDSLEDLLNSQLFNALGWEIRFNRKYKTDQLVETQTLNMMADTVTKYQSIFSAQGKQITTEKILSILNWNPEDIEDKEEEMEMEVENNAMNQNMLPNEQIMNQDDHNKRSNTKRNVANNKAVTNSKYNG